MKKISIVIFVLLCNFIAKANDTLTIKEIETLKTVAKNYDSSEKLYYFLGGLVAVLLIFGFVIKYYFEKTITDLVYAELKKDLGMEKEKDNFRDIFKSIVADHKLKQTPITIVSENGVNASFESFLKKLGFKNLTSMTLTNFESELAKNINFQLVVFNYDTKDLGIESSKFGTALSQLKNKARVVVLGSGRLPNNYKDELGNFLALSNGSDTIESSIIRVLKQDVISFS